MLSMRRRVDSILEHAAKEQQDDSTKKRKKEKDFFIRDTIQ
jgi:hypothetical protein